MKKRVGVFGGSFDPVHQGHTHIVNEFLASGLIDELLILLTPDPPHKEKSAQAYYDHRLKMLELAFADFQNVVISDLEKSLPVPSYTLQTIQYLKRENPGYTYFLCMGEDSIASFHTWYRYEDLLNQVTLVVANRPGITSKQISKEILEKTIFLNNSEVNISSTEIRLSEIEDTVVPQQVAQYIRKHKLYT